MDSLELMRALSQPSPSKIVFCVLDGLGGLPHPKTGKTELETARTPNLDRLATSGVCGLAEVVGAGITPGSGAGHLALFGYDPLRFIIGRGVLEAVGIDFNLEPKDIAARGNFCTVDEAGLVTDRRAGRILNDLCAELCQLFDGMVIDGVKILVRPVREHRFVIVFRGGGLNAEVSDSDPQQIGVAPKVVTALEPKAASLASVANEFIIRAKKILVEPYPANMVLLRGFSQRPKLPSIADIYKLKPTAIAVYPMYRGLARLIGMEILKTGNSIDEEFITLSRNYADHDFFFLHVKWPDSAGEDGDFDRKVKVIEEFDKALAEAINLEPDVMVVTGDHSTPAALKRHSWHPVPVLVYSKWCRPDRAVEFSESACLCGGLGHFPATQIMSQAMAQALKLTKYGA
ncbi:2,3-bisphosphoglycerate-independent phosphoglycerate mutase [Chloroflexota bacterium]